MSHLDNFWEKIIILILFVSVLNVQVVRCGCQRTNPEWFASDNNGEHLSAPIISFLPGNQFLLSKEIIKTIFI